MSRLHTYLFEVEVALDIPQHVVVDRAAVTHAQERVALGVDDVAADLSVLDELLLGLTPWRFVELLLMFRTVLVSGADLVKERTMPGPALVEIRSEERRVGEECGCRGW